MHRWASSPRARRTSTRHCTSESSVTNDSVQRALISSSLVTNRSLFSARYLRASKTLGRSLISSPRWSRQARSRSIENSPKERMRAADFVISLAFFGPPFVTRAAAAGNYSGGIERNAHAESSHGFRVWPRLLRGFLRDFPLCDWFHRQPCRPEVHGFRP